MLLFGIWILFIIFCLLLLYAPEFFSPVLSQAVSFTSILLGSFTGLIAILKIIGQKIAEDFSNNTFIVWSSGVKGYHLTLMDYAPNLGLLLCSVVTVFVAVTIYIRVMNAEK